MGMFSRRERTIADMHADKRKADAAYLKAASGFSKTMRQKFPPVTPEGKAAAKAQMDSAEAHAKLLASEIEESEATGGSRT